MSRERLIIPFGGGMERSSGKLAVRVGTMKDLRNVLLFNGKTQVRRGLNAIQEFEDENSDVLSHILGGRANRAERIGIVVGYQQDTGKVYVYRVTSTGTDPELLTREDGEPYWFALAAGSDRPSIKLADSYGKVFLAHDEASIVRRAQTYYYDGLEATPLRALVGDLDREGEAPIKFRGVVNHLKYILGWGFGTGGDQDRPELVRGSMPLDPTRFEPEHWWSAGQRGDPVLDVQSNGGVAVVLQETGWHQISGYDRKSFAIRPVDSFSGLGGSNLALAIEGRVYHWTMEGPAMTNGAEPSVSLAMPLDLRGFEPSDLPASSELQEGFSFFDPGRRLVIWVFGQRGYALNIQNPQEMKWSYMEFGRELTCAFSLIHSLSQGGAGAVQPTGYPKFVPVVDWRADSIQDYAAWPKVDHVGALGGEIMEIWLKPAAGAWALKKSVNAAIGQPRQEVSLASLSALTLYDIAYRYRSGGLYTPGYEGATPDAWTAPTAALSKGSFTTTQTARQIDPAIAYAWERVSELVEKVVIDWTGGPLQQSRIYKAADVAGLPGAPVLVDTVIAGVETYDYAPVGGEPETYMHFMVVPYDGAVEGTPSQWIRTWIGPQKPYGYVTGTGTASQEYGPFLSIYPLFNYVDQWNPNVEDEVQKGFLATWVNADIDLENEIWSNTDGAGWILVGTAAEMITSMDTVVPITDGQTIQVKMRHKLTTGATIDYSDFSAVVEVIA